MTDDQQKLLGNLREWIRTHGVPPTLQELMSASGTRDRKVVRRRLRVIADHGHIELVPGRKRGIYLKE